MEKPQTINAKALIALWFFIFLTFNNILKIYESGGVVGKVF